MLTSRRITVIIGEDKERHVVGEKPLKEKTMTAGVQILGKIALGDAIAQAEMNQREVARIAGIHYNNISEYKRGRAIRKKTAYSILRAINTKRNTLNMDPLGIEDIEWNIANF